MWSIAVTLSGFEQSDEDLIRQVWLEGFPSLIYDQSNMNNLLELSRHFIASYNSPQGADREEILKLFVRLARFDHALLMSLGCCWKVLNTT